MKQNYIDEKGIYHNELNYTLTQIHDSGAEFGYNIAKMEYAKEFEDIKSEIEFITKENGTSKVHIDDIRKIIDKHIKENKQ